jgi:sulfatase modifying factor 1
MVALPWKKQQRVLDEHTLLLKSESPNMTRYRIAIVCVLMSFQSLDLIRAQDDSKGVGVRDVSRALELLPPSEQPPRRFALIVSAGEYLDDQIPDLPQCMQDGKVVYNLLSDPQRGMFPVENIEHLTGPDVTRERVIGALERLASKANDDDLVVVYFSGHGATDTYSRAYWLMQDTKLSSLRGTALPDLDVTELLDRIPTNRLLVLIDACFSAATANLSTKAVIDTSGLYPKFSGRGRVAITASNGQQLSLVINDDRHPGNGHSVFTWHFKEAMEGAADQDRDGVLTVAEVWHHLTEHVPVTARQLHGEMTPQLKGQFGGRFLLAIDASQLSRRMEVNAELAEKRNGRLAILKDLALDGKITTENYKESQVLMELSPAELSSEQVDLLAEYIAVVDGTLPVDKLARALDLARATPVVIPSPLSIVGERPANQGGATIAANRGDAISQSNTDVPVFQGVAGKVAGEVRKISLPGGVPLRIVWCPSGHFQMGSGPDDPHAAADERPYVNVELTGFWVGETEVTQQQWRSLFASRPWESERDVPVGDEIPVTCVDWNTAFDFCRELSRLEQSAGRLPAGWAYRLPTEAQWEYACRAGSTSFYCFGNEDSQLGNYAWTGHNSQISGQHAVHQVAQKQKNAWGLYDVHGNAYEWTSCSYTSKRTGGKDPGGPPPNAYRVFRGGSALSTGAGDCRTARRNGDKPTAVNSFVGFRIVLGPNRQAASPQAVLTSRESLHQSPESSGSSNHAQQQQTQFYYEDDAYNRPNVVNSSSEGTERGLLRNGGLFRRNDATQDSGEVRSNDGNGGLFNRRDDGNRGLFNRSNGSGNGGGGGGLFNRSGRR